MTVSAKILFHRLVEASIDLSGVSANLLLLLLIHRCTRAEMRTYRVILLSSTIADLIFAGANLLTMQVMVVEHGQMIISHIGPLASLLHFERKSSLFAGVWSMGLTASYTNLCFQCVYRDRHLIGEKAGYSRRLWIIYGLMQLFNAFFAYVCTLIMRMGDELGLMAENGFIVDGIGIEAVTIDARSLRCFIVMAIYVIHFCSIYYIILLCARRVHRRMREVRYKMSTAMQFAQKQINRVLVVQTILPFFLMSIPITFNVCFTMFYIDLPGLGDYTMRVISLIPIANALTVILAVSTYRHAIRQFLSKLFHGLATKAVNAAAIMADYTTYAPRSESVVANRARSGGANRF